MDFLYQNKIIKEQNIPEHPPVGYIELDEESAKIYIEMLELLNADAKILSLTKNSFTMRRHVNSYRKHAEEALKRSEPFIITSEMYNFHKNKLEKHSDQEKVKEIEKKLKETYLKSRTAYMKERLNRQITELKEEEKVEISVSPLDEKDMLNLMNLVTKKEYRFDYSPQVQYIYNTVKDSLDSIMNPDELNRELIGIRFSDIFDAIYQIPLSVQVGTPLWDIDFENRFEYTNISKITEKIENREDLNSGIVRYIGLKGLKKAGKFRKKIEEVITDLEQNHERYKSTVESENEAKLRAFSLRKVLEDIDRTGKIIEKDYGWLKKIEKIDDVAKIIGESYDMFTDITENDRIEAEFLKRIYNCDLETAKNLCISGIPNNDEDNKNFIKAAGLKRVREEYPEFEMDLESNKSPYYELFTEGGVHHHSNIIDISNSIRKIYHTVITNFDSLLYDAVLDDIEIKKIV